MLYIWSYLKRYPKWLVLDFLGAIFFVIVNLGLPTVLARMIDQGINQGDQDKLYFWAVIMLVIIVLGTFGRVVLAYAASKLTTNMVKDMRDDVYAKLQEYSHDFLDESFTGLDRSFFRTFSSCCCHLCGGQNASLI